MAKVDPIPVPAFFGSAPRVLWIGSRRRLGALAEDLGDLLGVPPSRVVPVMMSDIDEMLLARVAPSCAFSMVTWVGGDVLEAARLLQSAGYRGPYRAFGPRVPDPAIIEREVRQAAPLIDFAVVAAGGQHVQTD